MATRTLQLAVVWNPSFVAFLALMACACVFFAFFVLRPRAKASQHRREPLSALGLLLQCLGYAILGILHRSPFAPLTPMPATAEIMVAAFTILLAIASLWLCIAAVLTLGKHWTYIATVGPEHQLITRGPYGLVRHPIYTGMLGLCIATGLAVSQWWALPVGLVVFAVGTWIRVRTEDQLLKGSHGAEFDAYTSRVPAIIPRCCHLGMRGEQ